MVRKATTALVVLALYVGVGIFDHEIWAPVEPTVAGIVWNMVETNDLAVPFVNDIAFYHHPPLYYWLAWLVVKVTGRLDAATLRLPAAILGLGCLGLVFWIARIFHGERVACVMVLFAATCGMFWDAAHHAGPDISALFFAFLCFALFARGLATTATTIQPEKRLSTWDWGFSVALAVSFYAKNLFIAFVVVPPIAALLIRRGLGRLFRIGVVTGAVLVTLLAPWTIALFRHGGWEALRIAFFDSTLGRFLPLQGLAPDQPGALNDAFVSEKESWSFYLPKLPAYPLPWTLLFAVALVGLVQKRRSLNDYQRYLLLGVVTVPFVLSLSSAKSTDYLSPILFFVFLIQADWLSDLLHGSRPPATWERWLVGFNAFLAVAAIGLFPLGLFIAFGGTEALLLLVPSTAAAAWLTVRFTRERLGDQWLFQLGCAAAIAFTVGLVVAMGPLDRRKSYRPFFEEAWQAVEGREVITTFLDYRRLPLINYYLLRRVRVETDVEAVFRALRSPSPIAVLTSSSFCKKQERRLREIPGVSSRSDLGRDELCLLVNSARS